MLMEHQEIVNKNEKLVSLLSHENLYEFGLSENNIEEIFNVSRKIQDKNMLSVSEFGRDVAIHTSNYSNDLLKQVISNDLLEVGYKLNKVVELSQSLNFNPLTKNFFWVPIIGKLIKKIKYKTTERFNSTYQQIERLLEEINKIQKDLPNKNAFLEETFNSIKKEYWLLGVHIMAGKLRLAELKELEKNEQLKTKKTQEIFDSNYMTNNLDKRIGDLVALQQSALQSLSVIRIIQSNNQALIDKFHTIHEVTIPVWKRQLILILTLDEQRNAVQLAKIIDDTTNDLLKKNANLLHHNSVETAKASHRLVIDIDTLSYVQDTLVKTIEEVINIHKEGMEYRLGAEKKISEMRKRMLKSGLANC